MKCFASGLQGEVTEFFTCAAVSESLTQRLNGIFRVFYLHIAQKKAPPETARLKGY
jgi:hypothetical protein